MKLITKPFSDTGEVNITDDVGQKKKRIIKEVMARQNDEDATGWEGHSVWSEISKRATEAIHGMIVSMLEGHRLGMERLKEGHRLEMERLKKGHRLEMEQLLSEEVYNFSKMQKSLDEETQATIISVQEMVDESTKIQGMLNDCTKIISDMTKKMILKKEVAQILMGFKKNITTTRNGDRTNRT